ncbi:integrase, partial [Pantoea ananatis]
EYATCCPVKTSEMRCHEISNTSLWFRRYPNFATRDSSVCAGCACAIIDKSHIAFWSERFTKSQIAIREAEAVGKMNGFRVILERAEQAKKILRKLGVNVSEL